MDKFGTTTAPEVPVPAHKKTLVGLPVPTPVMPAAKSAPPAAKPAAPGPAAAAAEAAARAASKKTLMGVAPPAVGRSTSRSSQPPPVKVPSHAPPPPPPPPPPDAGDAQSWAKGAPSAPPRIEPAAKSSPRSSRPSGVAKAYVPKEDPHTPAVVVAPDALRDGEAAAAAEEARRRARAEAARHAKTMRARPGELPFEPEPKSRKVWVVAAGLVAAFGIGGFLALRGSDDDTPAAAEPTEDAQVEAHTAAEPPIPVVPSPEALPVESPAAEPVAAEALPTGEPSPAREPGRVDSRASKPAARQNPPSNKRTESASKPAQSEPKKTAEPQKKNVIVRDAPF